MINLYQKALEVKDQYNHTVDDIDDIVKSTIKKLNIQYRKGQNKKEIEDSYISNEYKAFITYIKNDKKEFSNLLDECIINETRIAKFIKGKTKRPHNKTKDFFAVYCGCEGYHDFIVKNKNVEIPLETFSIKNELNLQISGATIINEEFIQKVKSGKTFTMPEFYTAKQNEDCQWYGIIKQWDIERTIYPEVKLTVENCFEKERNFKVSAVIHGDGGCGKSTLLRRLAVNLSSYEEFKIIWIDNFEEFVNGSSQNIFSGWEMIKNDFSNRYIIFIEDWYSKVDYNGTSNSKKFLKNAQINKNVRIILGDRNIQGKHYLEHLYNDNNKFLLLPAENRFILDKVIQKIPEWETFINETFLNKLGSAPLFMVLFILAKAIENKELSGIDLSEPHKEFQNIIINSLNQLVDYKCSGLAKALHYWSCIYSEFRIQIPYETLLLLAKHFNSKDDLKPKNYQNLQLNSKISQILNTFIGIRLHSKKYNQQVFYFNHDILSDSGLSKASLEKWNAYDEILLKSILNLFVNNGGDVSASVFLQRMIMLKPNLFKDKSEQLEFINLLIDRKIKHYDYTACLVNDIPLSIEEIDAFAERLWNIEHYNNLFWSYVLNKKELRDKWSSVILSNFDLEKSPLEIVPLALSHSKDKAEHGLVQQVCRMILEGDVLMINPDIVINALKWCLDEMLIQNACRVILVADVLIINPDMITNALKKCVDDKLIQKASKIILEADFLKVPKEVTTNALNKCNDYDLVQSACKTILEEDVLNIPSQILINVFKLCNNNNLIQNVCKIILEDDVLSINPQTLNCVLKLCEDNNLIQNACRIILKDDILSVNPQTSSFVLKLCKDHDLVQNACKTILKKGVLNISPDIASCTLELCDDDNLVQNSCKTILKSDISKINPSVFSRALMLSQNDNSVQNVCKTILEQDIFKFNRIIVVSALKVCTDNHLVDNACETILRSDLLKSPPDLISIAFRYSTNDKLKKKIAKFFLDNYLNSPKFYSIVNQALLF